MTSNGLEKTPDDNTKSCSVSHKQGRGVFVYTSLLFLVAAACEVSIAIDIFRRVAIALEGTPVPFGIVWSGIGLALAFVATIPASLVAVAWCLILLVRKPQLGWNGLTFAILTLLAYFILVVAIVYQLNHSGPYGDAFH